MAAPSMKTSWKDLTEGSGETFMLSLGNNIPGKEEKELIKKREGIDACRIESSSVSLVTAE